MLSTISWVLKTEITALSIRNTYKVIQHMPRRKVKLESFLSSSSEKKKKNGADTYLGCFGWAVTLA